MRVVIKEIVVVVVGAAPEGWDGTGSDHTWYLGSVDLGGGGGLGLGDEGPALVRLGSLGGSQRRCSVFQAPQHRDFELFHVAQQ